MFDVLLDFDCKEKLSLNLFFNLLLYNNTSTAYPIRNSNIIIGHINVDNPLESWYHFY